MIDEQVDSVKQQGNFATEQQRLVVRIAIEGRSDVQGGRRR